MVTDCCTTPLCDVLTTCGEIDQSEHYGHEMSFSLLSTE